MFGLILFITTCLASIEGHGYLLDPVARSTAWLVDPSFKQCCTYPDHMGMYCGGIEVQWKVNGQSFVLFAQRLIEIHLDYHRW